MKELSKADILSIVNELDKLSEQAKDIERALKALQSKLYTLQMQIYDFNKTDE